MLRHSHYKHRDLLEFAKANPGTVTYPRPPDFTGTAFLEQLLIMLTPDPTALKEARTMRLSPVSLRLVAIS
ncbi:hypothetical protein DKG79_09075 [Escherichia fergusonii]|nr:hypothetical protein DKG79_09075 [Escherichia fergusonii]